MSEPDRKDPTPQTSPIVDEIDVLIRARYPIIYVVSWEEGRVEQHLQRIASKQGKELHEWSVTLGLRKVGDSHAGARSKGLADPVEALETLIEYKEPAIYLFKDFHPFVRPATQGNIPFSGVSEQAPRQPSQGMVW